MQGPFSIINRIIAMFLTLGFVIPALSYTAHDSTEAFVEFSAFVEMLSPVTPLDSQQNEQVEKQLKHLFGPLAAAKFPAVPKLEYKINLINSVRISKTLIRINYNYRGYFLVHSGAESELNIVLPINPDTIYQAGQVLGKNPCTDSHYYGIGDFWYFWNPKQEGCPLKAEKDYLIQTASLVRKPNQEVSYPEYSRLMDADGVVKVSLFYGMDKAKLNRDPYVVSYADEDENAHNYRYVYKKLKQMGFMLTEVNSESEYYSEVFEKNYSVGKNYKKIRVETYFGPTDLHSRPLIFNTLFKNAIEHSSVLIYDGHSGLGGNLKISTMETQLNQKIIFPLDRYQLFLINSCTSYPYYNAQYFMRKVSPSDPQGTKQLDIITSGLESYFETLHNSSAVLISTLDSFATFGIQTSYQDIAKKVEAGNLFGVNGDEDNLQ